MKVLVSSNCQTVGLCRALQLLMPDDEIVSVWFQSLLDPEQKPALFQQYREADLIFSINWDALFQEFSAGRVKELNPNVIFIPGTDFAGFHPDLTYAQSRPHRNMSTPMGDYNSVIVLASYLAGIDVERVPNLFNAFIFSKLGYFDAFEPSRAAMVKLFADFGLDIAEAFEGWRRRGCFMHTINHPKPYVIADLARIACLTHGVGKVEDVPYGDLIHDDLVTAPICPVFPEIAGPLGVPGSRHFKTALTPLHPRERLMDLGEYVRECYKTFATTDTGEWVVSPRIRDAAALFKDFA